MEGMKCMETIEGQEGVTFEWEDPPPSAGGSRRPVWPDRLAPLKAQPGKWALFAPSVSSSAVTDINRGKYGPGFQATTRGASGQQRLYVRFVGEAIA